MKAHCAVLLTCFLAISAGAQAERSSSQPAAPLPLDPLTASERAAAEEVARANARAKEFLAAGRSLLISVEFIAPKRDPKAAEPAGRFADVLFYRYTDDAGLRLLIDLSVKRVVDVVSVPGRSVPLAAAEIEESARVALASTAVARLLGEGAGSFRVATGPATREQMNENRIEGLRTLGTSENDPCTHHRCVVLFFRSQSRYVALNRVVTDLTTGQVLIDRGGRKP